jgi:hypothetical protein
MHPLNAVHACVFLLVIFNSNANNSVAPDANASSSPLAQSPRASATVLTPFKTGAKLLNSLRRKARQSPSGGDNVSLDGSTGSGDSIR